MFAFAALYNDDGVILTNSDNLNLIERGCWDDLYEQWFAKFVILWAQTTRARLSSPDLFHLKCI